MYSQIVFDVYNMREELSNIYTFQKINSNILIRILNTMQN